ncbi:MAG: LysE family transporter [Firmicutes bacterium]|nr:LysE family transporter [Bacillota bacterium]
MTTIFLSALAVAFSGAIMPGPLLTYTIRQSLNTGPYAGLIIIAGHAFLEIVLVVLIFMGFGTVLQSGTAQAGIGIVGGLLLLFMGLRMIRDSVKNKININPVQQNYFGTGNMFFTGIAISIANPYFLLWWAIIGLGFLLQAYKSCATAGVIIFYLGHILADFTWYGLISIIVGKTRQFINNKPYRVIIAFLGGILVFFGISFFYKALLLMNYF